MRDSPTVIPLFLIESDHKNWEIVISNAIYQNLDLDLYQNWLEEKKNRDYRYNSKDEKIWLVTQMVDRKNENENNVDITIKDKILDDDLSLSIIY